MVRKSNVEVREPACLLGNARSQAVFSPHSWSFPLVWQAPFWEALVDRRPAWVGTCCAVSVF